MSVYVCFFKRKPPYKHNWHFPQLLLEIAMLVQLPMLRLHRVKGCDLHSLLTLSEHSACTLTWCCKLQLQILTKLHAMLPNEPRGCKAMCHVGMSAAWDTLDLLPLSQNACRKLHLDPRELAQPPFSVRATTTPSTASTVCNDITNAQPCHCKAIPSQALSLQRKAQNKPPMSRRMGQIARTLLGHLGI